MRYESLGRRLRRELVDDADGEWEALDGVDDERGVRNGVDDERAIPWTTFKAPPSSSAHSSKLSTTSSRCINLEDTRPSANEGRGTLACCSPVKQHGVLTFHLFASSRPHPRRLYQRRRLARRRTPLALAAPNALFLARIRNLGSRGKDTELDVDDELGACSVEGEVRGVVVVVDGVRGVVDRSREEVRPIETFPSDDMAFWDDPQHPRSPFKPSSTLSTTSARWTDLEDTVPSGNECRDSPLVGVQDVDAFLDAVRPSQSQCRTPPSKRALGF
ncbi:hypothetical protein NMY22_g16538 [Coprinellus aureogranulatus]|nr:hypothetical protein NMY22_g16538 [Coprinellus aureogranulatus]